MLEWTKELFDLAYESSAEPDGHPNTRPGIRLHYNRYVMYPEMLRRAQQFIQILSITTADRILVVGCGFGWSVEAFVGLGYTAVGTDISTYIHGTKDLSEDADVAAAIVAAGLDPASGEGLVHFNRLKSTQRSNAPVLNEDSASNRSRNQVKSALGGAPTIVITEDLVTSLSDAECGVLQANIEKYATGMKVAHFLTVNANPNPPFNFNSKSIEDWKLLFPTSTIIADGYKFKVL